MRLMRARCSPMERPRLRSLRELRRACQGRRTLSAPAQAASATMVNPGITRTENERPPAAAMIILLIVLVDSPARIGMTASEALIFPDATRDATEIAAECASTNPAN